MKINGVVAFGLALSICVPMASAIPNFSSVEVSAETNTTEDGFVYEVNTSEDYVTITGYTGSDTYVYIPSEIDGYPVATIGYEAFKDCDFIETVEVPETVTTIESYAFENCTSLYRIKYYVYTDASETAFEGCDNVKVTYILPSTDDYPIYEPTTNSDEDNFKYTVNTSRGYVTINKYIGWDVNVTIPSEIEGYPVTTIDDEAFSGWNSSNYYNNQNVESVTIPDTVTSIGDSAFYGCYNLRSVQLPDSLTSIGDYAFANCPVLNDIALPLNLTSIGDYAFYQCSNLTEVYVPSSVTSLGSYAFENCTSLYRVDISNGVNAIGRGVFYGCSALNELNLPNSITYIGSWAFKNCTSLGSINIPSSVTTICSWAFENCSSLKWVIVPSSVKCVYNGAFTGCDNLSTVIVKSYNTDFYGDVFDYYNDINMIYDCDNDDDVTTEPDVTQPEDPYYYYIYDVNQDGTENVLDLLALKKHLLGII